MVTKENFTKLIRVIEVFKNDYYPQILDVTQDEITLGFIEKHARQEVTLKSDFFENKSVEEIRKEIKELLEE